MKINPSENPDYQTFCPKCHRMYCPGFWGEGVCTADMHFCGEPTATRSLATCASGTSYTANRGALATASVTRWDRDRIEAERTPTSSC